MGNVCIRAVVVAVLLLVSGAAKSTELLCSGHGWASIGDGFESTAVVKLDQKNLQVSVSFWAGTAKGPLTVDERIYKGMLTLPTGRQVWINLNRYTGELFVAPPSDSPIKHIFFNGVCQLAQAKF